MSGDPTLCTICGEPIGRSTCWIIGGKPMHMVCYCTAPTSREATQDAHQDDEDDPDQLGHAAQEAELGHVEYGVWSADSRACY